MKERFDLLPEIRRRSGEPLALATVVATEGHAYRRVGARLLLNAHGPILGSISGGCLEADIALKAWKVLASGKAELHDYDLRGDLDLIWGSGSGCEGSARILVEPLNEQAPWLAAIEKGLDTRREGWLETCFDPKDREFGRHRFSLESPMEPREGTLVERIIPPIQVWIFGAGSEALPLLNHARLLGWPTGIVDHRPASARPERFPGAMAVLAGHPRQVIPDLPLDAWTACLLLTHHFHKDLEALELLLPSEVGYVGLMGHRERARNLLQGLRERGLRPTPVELARFYAPIGLDLGGTSSETIALAILGEIQGHFAGASGLYLRDRVGALHQ